METINEFDPCERRPVLADTGLVHGGGTMPLGGQPLLKKGCEQPEAPQTEHCRPTTCPNNGARGDEQARIRGGTAPARPPDAMDHWRGDRGLDCARALDPGQPSKLLRQRDPDLSAAAEPSREAERLRGRLAISAPSVAGLPRSCRSRGDRFPSGPLHVLIDSIGLRVHGARPRLADKQEQRARRKWRGWRGWRKLHLAAVAAGGKIVCVTLTNQDLDEFPGESAARSNRIADRSGHGRRRRRR